MYGYVYLDYGNDGVFDFLLNESGTPVLNSDAFSYSYYNGKNSTRTTVSNQNPGKNSPVFTIPAGTTPGIYRVRYKVDWDNIDAGGNAAVTNNIISNGGGITDAC